MRLPRAITLRWAATLVLLALSSPQAFAETIPTVSSNGEPALGTILDHFYGAGNWVQVPTDQLWAGSQFGSTPLGIAFTAMAKFAGHSHEFGYYTDPNGSPVFHALGTVTGSGYVDDPVPANRPVVTPAGSGVLTAGQSGDPFAWGLHDLSSGNYFSSVESFNGDTNAAMKDHMLTAVILNRPGTFVIAWEDLLSQESSDRDFNDLVIEISAVPEPASILLATLGAGALSGCYWRQRRRLRAA